MTSSRKTTKKRSGPRRGKPRAKTVIVNERPIVTEAPTLKFTVGEPTIRHATLKDG